MVIETGVHHIELPTPRHHLTTSWVPPIEQLENTTDNEHSLAGAANTPAEPTAVQHQPEGAQLVANQAYDVICPTQQQSTVQHTTLDTHLHA